ncbi:MAG: alanine/glycine:cation symporter family protein, partial [Eubacteriales bacterium]
MIPIGGIFLLYLLAAGGYTAYRLRFFCFVHPVRCVKMLFGRGAASSDDKNRISGSVYSPMKALTVALAGTLGVGNITGVAAALALGGPGALFWMWISAFCTMLIKYAEVYLAVRCRESRPVFDKRTGKTGTEYHGGPMRYFHFYRSGGILSAVFCVLCVTASFVQGNLLQTGAAVSCLSGLTGIGAFCAGCMLTVLAALLIFGGRTRISAFTETMIPFMTGLYVLMGAVILFRNIAVLPDVFAEILKSAFSVRAAAGGGGVSVLAAMRHGCAKGVFSHEAGCGTSPISHAGAVTDSPEKQGILGIAEVFVDTIILCTVTGLVLLLSRNNTGGTESYAETVLNAFAVWFGEPARWILGISIVFYAFATLVCWSFYGSECV